MPQPSVRVMRGILYDKVWRAIGTTCSVRAFKAVWKHSDGYGALGRIPPQGYDWSGMRDSSDLAIENMFFAAKALGLFEDKDVRIETANVRNGS